jgi:RES domain-containing protein
MLTSWRITQRSHWRTAFNGDGARIYGGRWNSVGTAVIYTAGSQALAVLEMLAHMDSPELLKRYVLFEVQFGEALVKELTKSMLPRSWKRSGAAGGAGGGGRVGEGGEVGSAGGSERAGAGGEELFAESAA